MRHSHQILTDEYGLTKHRPGWRICLVAVAYGIFGNKLSDKVQGSIVPQFGQVSLT